MIPKWKVNRKACRLSWAAVGVLVLTLTVAGCGGRREPEPVEPVAAPAAEQAGAGAVETPVVETPVAATDAGAAASDGASAAGVGVAVGEGQSAAAEAVQAGPTETLAATPTVTPAAMPAEALSPLEEALRLHRYGDFAAARERFNEALADPSLDVRTQMEIRYDIARSLLAEGFAGEALPVLDQLVAQGTVEAIGNEPEIGVIVGRARYLRGEAYLALGRVGEAVTEYSAFLEAYPWTSEAVAPRLAQAYVALGDIDSAAAMYRRAAEAAGNTAGDPVAQVTILERLAQMLTNAGRHSEAAAAYADILAVAQRPAYRTQIQYQAGVALAAAGDEAGAIERWRAATAEDITVEAAYRALVELVNRNVEFDLYRRGAIDLYAGAWLPAINAYEAFLAAAPADDARRGQALLELGQAYLGAGNAVEAGALFDRVVAEHPDCACVGQAWLDRGRAYVALGDLVAARRTYRTFAREHPADVLAPEALWRSGLLALRDGNQIEGALDFLSLADAFPESTRAPAALYAVGLGAQENGLHGQAVQAFLRLQEGYPEYRWDAVGYWLGRAQQAQGNEEAAAAAWQALVGRAPDIYYGVLAGQALAGQQPHAAATLTAMEGIVGPRSTLAGDDGSRAFAERWLAEWWQVDAGGVATLPVEAVEDPNLALGRMMLELDERGAALVTLDRVYERFKDNPQALYPLALEFERIGAYRLSLTSMQRLMQFSPAKLVEDAPIFIQEHVYPRQFGDLVVKEATANDLDPLLFFSLIRQESLFEEGAQSVAAAQGLAQIIPDTGAWVAERLGWPNYSNELIYRPYINLKFGAYYLDWARDFLDGNLVSGLVGYNAGPGNAQRWRELSGPDDALYVELLEYSEPRVYVQAVTTNLYHYTRLYGAE